MFDPFVQADVSHTRRYGGTGLGLTLVRLPTERMGGVVSQVGRGTTFRVQIPKEVRASARVRLAG